MRAVVLLSGGMDSAAALAVARSEGYACHAISFKYGQRHAVEIEAARRIAAWAGVEDHKVVNIGLGHFGGSALTDSHLEVPTSGVSDGIPITYVPARNTVLLAYALAYAEVREADTIFMGVNAVDYSGYPDCRPEYIEAWEKMANLATKAAVEGQRLSVKVPLISLTKSEIVKLGADLGVPWELTHSCYLPDVDTGIACGTCDSCRIRQRGFSEAGIKDPISYQAAAA